MLALLLKPLDDRELVVTQGSPFHFGRAQEIKTGIKSKRRVPLHGGPRLQGPRVHGDHFGSSALRPEGGGSDEKGKNQMEAHDQEISDHRHFQALGQVARDRGAPAISGTPYSESSVLW